MVCEHCAARGLCRKDFWSGPLPGKAPAEPRAFDASPLAATDPRDDLTGGLVDGPASGPIDAAGPVDAGPVPPPWAVPAYRHNGRLLSRERFYEIACDPRRFVAVEACAGAGKTWMLVSRILRALLEEGDGSCEPHEILAITFTRKAAGEMRARLDEWLERFARSDLAILAGELRSRGLDAAAAAAAAPRLKALHARLLQSARPVQVRTFHGWFAGLLRHAPLAVLERLELPTSYQLLEDDAEARQRVWRPFFASLVDDADALADYHALVATHGRSQTAKALGEAITRRVEFVLADRRGDVADGVRHFAAADASMAHAASPAAWLLAEGPQREQLLRAAKALGAASAKTFAAKGVELEMALSAGHAPGIQSALLTLAGEPRKFGEKIAGIDQVRLAQDLVLRYCAAHAQHEAWLYQQRMTRLTRKLLAAFAEVKRLHGWIDMNDVESAAHLLLSDPVLSGWLQERLDARVRHLLIDEFQDTNPMQWQALHGWLSGYAGAGGKAPSIFLVGDPKQSIYRFRRAEPQVFIAAQAFVGEVLGGDLLSCDHTHRNAPAVIGLVNAAMHAAQAQGEFSGYREHTTESRVAGRTTALPQIERDTVVDDALAGAPAAGWRDSLVTPRVLPEDRLIERECRQAAAWIARRIADGCLPSSLMVLARRRSRLAVMQDELRSLGIAVQQPEKNDLNDAPEVQDIVALLDVLVSPSHDLSLARALRSPLFGLQDAALVTLARLQRDARAAAPGDGSDSPDWFDLLQGALAPPELAEIGGTLARWQAWTRALPPHDALAAIYHEGDVLARFAAAAPPPLRDSVLSNLRGLLAAALELDGARFATPYGLVRALRAGGLRAPAVASRDAVQLLTVHGAKGLEADTVLMIDCDTPPQRAQTMGVLVVWPGEKPVPDRFVFVASERRPSICVVDDLAAEHAARQREEINALYVATTRARAELVLSSVRAATENPLSWWSRLRAGCESEAVRTGAVADPSQAGVAGSFELREWPASQPIPAAPLRTEFATPEASRASLLGQAMHRLLERSGPGGPIPSRLQSAVGLEFGLTTVELSRAVAIAERIRGGAAAWVWDDALLAWQGNEVELHHRGQLLRIDRLVQERASSEWWVLDHKSASHPQRDPALVAKLGSYREAVRAAYPGARVHAAFLTGQGELVVVD
ncbi:MAG: DNA helicase UvrD [Comamonadaceae bacterium]|nr:MAG: DNA helicase UvrD [Comamonadaceae bacterium]